jgi:hypothetical protein
MFRINACVEVNEYTPVKLFLWIQKRY